MLAEVGLGRRRENRRSELVGLAQAGRQRDPADRAGRLVILPARTDDIAAHHRFHQDRLQALGDDRAAFDLIQLVRAHHALGCYARHMIRHDMAELVEPEIGHLVQHHALARNRFIHHDVERRQPVAGDDQDLVVADCVVVAHFAASEQRKRLDGGLVEAVHNLSQKSQTGRCRNTPPVGASYLFL